MSNPEKPSTSADKEEDKEERRTNTDQEVTTTTTTTTTVVTPPTRRRRSTVQVRPASGGSKRSKSSEVKGAGSSSSSKTGKQKRKRGELDAPKGEPRCPICGSRFGSWKGYFGHLRVHPYPQQRDWPGAFPPPTFKPGEEMVDEQFQDYFASELSRIGHETLHKMRQEESSTGASNTRAGNAGIDLNVEPEVDDHRTAEFDLNLPPRKNDDSDGDDDKKDDDDAPAT